MVIEEYTKIISRNDITLEEKKIFMDRIDSYLLVLSKRDRNFNILIIGSIVVLLGTFTLVGRIKK